MTTPVSCLVPTRSHVCVPGDAVLLLRGRNAVVTLGDGLYPMPIDLPQVSQPYSARVENNQSNDDEVIGVSPAVKRERGVLVLAQYCAPLQVEHLTTRASVPKYFLECPASKRYAHPRLHDPVIAIVVKSLGAQYVQCYINATAMAVMSSFAFDGASKSSRPRLKEGDVLYAYISALPTLTNTTNVPEIIDYVIDTQRNEEEKTHEEKKQTTEAVVGIDIVKDINMQQSKTKLEMQRRLSPREIFVKTSISNVRYASELELSCEAAAIGFAAKDWSSKEAIFGQLHGGQLLNIPLSYAESLLAPIPAHLLTRLHNKHCTAKSRTGQYKRERSGANEKNNLNINDEESISNTTLHHSDANVGILAAHMQNEAPASYLIALLGQLVSFDFCVGRNGYCWVKANASVAHSTSTTSGVTLAKSKENGITSGNNLSERKSSGASQISDYNSQLTVNNEMKVNIALSSCISEARYDVTVDEMEMRVESYFAI